MKAFSFDMNKAALQQQRGEIARVSTGLYCRSHFSG